MVSCGAISQRESNASRDSGGQHWARGFRALRRRVAETDGDGRLALRQRPLPLTSTGCPLRTLLLTGLPRSDALAAGVVDSGGCGGPDRLGSAGGGLGPGCPRPFLRAPRRRGNRSAPQSTAPVRPCVSRSAPHAWEPAGTTHQAVMACGPSGTRTCRQGPFRGPWCRPDPARSNRAAR